MNFKVADIVDSYRKQNALNQNLIDLIPRLNMLSRPDMEILETWKKHFKDQGIPYIVTKDPINKFNTAKKPYKRVRLWKELRIDY